MKKMKVKKMMMKKTRMKRIVRKMRKKDMRKMKALLMKSKTNKKLQRNLPILMITSQLTMMNQNLSNTLTLILKRKSLKNKRLQELLLKKQRLKVIFENFGIEIFIFFVETKKGKGKKKSKKEKAKRKKRREPKASEGVVLEDVFVNKRYVYGAPFTDFHQFYFKGDYLDFDPDEFFRVELVNEKGGLTNVILYY